ncbi:hypothetical protein HMPREF0496_0913 [Lentilactobacillus hilgardii ATCC 27305]|nr:hypothetical protein HMPREF0496_0913 [Lentilactobacillus hilgardii ATCC 27305]
MHIFRITKKNRKNPSHDDRINQKACFFDLLQDQYYIYGII